MTIARGLLFAAVVASTRLPVQSTPAAASPFIELKVQQGSDPGNGEVQPLLRGAPMGVLVTLGNRAEVDAFQRMLRGLGDERPAAGRAVVLPTEGRGWTDYLEIELWRHPESGADELIVDKDTFRQAITRAREAATPETEILDFPVHVGVSLPPDDVAALGSVTCIVRVKYDTRNAAGEEVWKGVVELASAPMPLRDPASPIEQLNVRYHLATWLLGEEQFLQAVKVTDEIIASDPASRNHRAYVLGAEARIGVHDGAGAIALLDVYLEAEREHYDLTFAVGALYEQARQLMEKESPPK